MPTQHVHTLEWLAAKKYAALCVTGMVDHHIQYISTFPHEIRKKILFFVQRTSVDEAVLCSLLSPGDVRTLDFSSVPMSTNVDFSRVLQLCPLLTSLNISNWKLGKIPEILRQSLTLKSINVGCSINFQDSDLIAICQSCPNLTYLDLSRNDSLSDVGIVALASTCTQLVGLKITYVDGITETGLHRLLETCTNLETLNNAVLESPDVTRPIVQSANLNYSTGVLIIHASETLDAVPATLFDLTKMKVNDRVIWMKYNYTGEIDQTGFGIVLEIIEKDRPFIIILKDDGDIGNFNPSMVQLFEDWDE